MKPASLRRLGPRFEASSISVATDTPLAPPPLIEGGVAVAGTPRFGEHFAEGYEHMLCSARHLSARKALTIRRLAGL